MDIDILQHEGNEPNWLSAESKRRWRRKQLQRRHLEEQKARHAMERAGRKLLAAADRIEKLTAKR